MMHVMADDMTRRREIAAAAFIMRRSELGLTQEDVAYRGGIAVKSVHNFEAHRRYPNARTRACLERAVEWPVGEIERRASGNGTGEGPLLAAIDRLQAELDQLREEYRQSQRKTNGHDGDGAHRAG